MVTGGQLSSFSAAGGAASPTACDFEPNNSLNRLEIEGLELESDEPPSMLPPPHPERAAPATASASAMRRRPPWPIVRIISPLRIIQMSPKIPQYGAPKKAARGRRVITAQ